MSTICNFEKDINNFYKKYSEGIDNYNYSYKSMFTNYK